MKENCVISEKSYCPYTNYSNVRNMGCYFLSRGASIQYTCLYQSIKFYDSCTLQ